MMKTMKKILALLSLLVLLGCDSKNAWDCIQTAGDIVEKEVEASYFRHIIVWDGVQLVLSNGNTERVAVQSGENLIDDIKIRVEDSILKISNRNDCNLIRDYGISKVFVVTNLDTLVVRNSSGLSVENRGPLRFRQLTLISDDRAEEDEFHIDGDFNLNQLDLGLLITKANGISTFRLSGKAAAARFNLFDSDVRVEAADFEVDAVSFFHRSTNKLIVNPRESIVGTIVSLGDVIAKNRPPFVEVEELFRGRLIFE